MLSHHQDAAMYRKVARPCVYLGPHRPAPPERSTSREPARIPSQRRKETLQRDGNPPMGRFGLSI